jgi:hypothetical protein
MAVLADWAIGSLLEWKAAKASSAAPPQMALPPSTNTAPHTWYYQSHNTPERTPWKAPKGWPVEAKQIRQTFLCSRMNPL